MRSAQSAVLHREHIRLMQELEEQAIREESKSHHNFLSTCQAILHHAPQPLKENLTTSYHVLFGQSPPSAQPARAPPVEEQPPTAASPKPAPKQSSWPKRQHPLPELQGSMSIDETSPRAMQEGLSSSKTQETPIWFASLKPSHAVEVVFKELAESTSLLGEAIHKIQLLWTGPEELKQANYALQSLPKGLRFLRAVPTTESPKVMGLMGIHDPNAIWHYAGYTYCPWCGKEGQNEGTVVNHLRTTHYRLGLVSNWCFGCPTVMLDSLHQHGHQNCQQYCVPSGSGLSN